MHYVQRVCLGLISKLQNWRTLRSRSGTSGRYRISLCFLSPSCLSSEIRPTRRPGLLKHTSHCHVLFYVTVSNQVVRRAISACTCTYTRSLSHTQSYSLGQTLLPHIHTLPTLMAVMVSRRLNADATADTQRSLLPHAPHHLIYNQHTCVARLSMHEPRAFGI